MAFNPNSIAVQPITSLTPFLGGKHWFKARAVDKTDIRTWNKPNSSGKLFSCTFVDESASIRCTFFNEAVDAFFAMLQENKVYYVGGGNVKTANRRFSNVNNEYELSLDKDASVHLATDATGHIPTQRYNFVPITTLKMKEENSPIDVLAVVTKVAPTAKIVTKAGQELTKREVTLADMTASVDITFWNDDAVSFSYDIGSVLALRSVRVRHFNGVTLSSGRDSRCDVSPAIPDTEKLRRWYQTTGGQSESLSGVGREGGASTASLGRRYFRQIDSEGLGKGEKPEYITVRCVPTYIRTESVMYDACPNCNKKVDRAVGTRCEKCQQDVQPVAKFMTSVLCSDGVSSRWVTIFNDAGEPFWGVSAEQLKADAMTNPQAITLRAQTRLYKPVLLTIRVKEERGMTNTEGQALEDRVRCTVVRVEDFVYGSVVPGANGHTTAAECRNLIESIQEFHI